MEERKWENLELDCLANAFGRVGMESLLLDVPFVCKSWYKASLDPSCWKRLVFPRNIESDWMTTGVLLLDRFMEEYKIGNCSVDAFVKFIVGRSHGNCTCLLLPSGCTQEVIKYIADECPALISLSLPLDILRSTIIPTLIGKWEHLEDLSLGSSRNFVDIITQISLCCKKFSALRLLSARIGEAEASAIVTNLPNIKYLVLRGGQINFKNLVIIVEGCKSLVYLDVSDCIGFDPDDEKVLELASHIKTFKCEGSMLEEDYYEDYNDYEDFTEFLKLKAWKNTRNIVFACNPISGEYIAIPVADKEKNRIEMEERKWENLELDCLANVFGRVGMESLLLDVPFVCKSWYKASLDPSCWKRLVFPRNIESDWMTTGVLLLDRFMEEYKIGNCSVDAFVKFIVGRSHGNCTRLLLPSGCTEEVVKYIADE
ncbi:unnamed protein product [Dovyalis caffra]|uniref:F-box domain-containing protein n=1 Tax=Dovyalis caffra TaxID=77055 RepID=A0AAV1RUI7_9ROSI|nr:unnamed protein product [Dovyalis caffra]